MWDTDGKSRNRYPTKQSADLLALSEMRRNRNPQVRLKIHALSGGIRITPITTTIHKPLIAHRNHMIRIELFNKRARLRRPIRDNGRLTPITPRFIGQLPRKDRRAVQVPAYDGFDVRLVLSLHFGVCVPGCFRGAVEGVVGGHTAVVAPVVHEVDD